MCSAGFVEKNGHACVCKDPRANYIVSRAAVLAWGELFPEVFCDLWLNTREEKALREPVIVATNFSLFVKYRVIHSLKNRTKTLQHLLRICQETPGSQGRSQALVKFLNVR